MAILSLDNVGAGAIPPVEFWKAATATLTAARPFSLFYESGIPGAAVASSAGMGGEALTSYSGQLPFSNPASGTTELCRFAGYASPSGVLLLCDRLWHNSGITITSTGAQAISSVAFPARDANGSSNGASVLIGVEVTTQTGAGTPTLTLDYTNQAGTAGRTATNIVATGASSIVGSFYPIGLQAGDTGVRSIQNYTQSATWTSGAVSLVAYRILARLEFPASGQGNALDWISSGGPQAHDNTVPFLIYVPTSASSATLSGHVIWTQG